MGGMALSPQTIDALGQALDAVVQEAGNDPQYADLVHALTSAQDALPAASDHPDAHHAGQPVDHGQPADHGAPADQNMSANDMFAQAEAKHKAARSGKGQPPSGH